MKSLTVELTKGREQIFQSIGWKTPQNGDRRLQFYALDENGQSLVVALTPAKPEWYVPTVKAVLSREPFPEAVCIEIRSCRLLPPRCYQSSQEVEQQFPFNSQPDPGAEDNVESQDKPLILRSSDDAPLTEWLSKWLVGARNAYERERTAWNERIKRATTTSLEELGIDSDDKREKKLAELRAELAIVESDAQIDGIACQGWLNLTLEDVKQGRAGIRDAYLHAEWAKRHGEDLAEMERARAVFCAWLETHTGTPADEFHVNSRLNLRGIAPPRLGDHPDRNPQFELACREVRWRARFADNAGTVVYLSDCELRRELTAGELDESDRLRSASKSKAVTFSSNYHQVFWIENGERIEAKLTPNQATAIAALHQAPGHLLSREEWQQEIHGDSPPADFRPDKLFRYRDGLKIWKRFIRVEGNRYRLTLGDG